MKDVKFPQLDDTQIDLFSPVQGSCEGLQLISVNYKIEITKKTGDERQIEKCSSVRSNTDSSQIYPDFFDEEFEYYVDFEIHMWN